MFKTWTWTKTVFSWNVKTETENCYKFSKVLGSDEVLEYYSSRPTTFGVLVLATPGTGLVLVLKGQCTRYSVKKSAEYTSTFGFR